MSTEMLNTSVDKNRDKTLVCFLVYNSYFFEAVIKAEQARPEKRDLQT